MFLCRLTSCLSTDVIIRIELYAVMKLFINDDRDTQREITDRDTNDDRDTGNINDNWDTQREITDWDTGTQITTGTQGI